MGDLINKEDLLESAKKWAHQALTAYLSEDNATAIACAGISWEHLCKACLCSVNSVLILTLENNARKNWQVLSGIMGLTSVRSSDGPPHTITAEEAQFRARALRGLRFDDGILLTLIHARHSVLHSGLLPKLSVNLVFAEFLRASNEIFDELSIEQNNRWGESIEFISQLLAENVQDVVAQVSRKLTRARVKLVELRETMPAEMWGEFVHARQTRQSDESALFFDRPLGSKMDRSLVILTSGDTPTVGPRFRPDISAIIRDECPVCRGGKAAFFGYPFRSGENEWRLTAQRFWCGLCELEFETTEEVRIGTGREIQLLIESDLEEIFGPDWIEEAERL